MYVPVYYREFTANTLTISKDWKLDIRIRGNADISKKVYKDFDNRYSFSYYFLSKDATKKVAKDSIYISNVTISSDEGIVLKQYPDRYRVESYYVSYEYEEIYSVEKSSSLNPNFLIPRGINKIYLNMDIEIIRYSGDIFQKEITVSFVRDDRSQWEWRMWLSN
jgi:hypothetical protein